MRAVILALVPPREGIVKFVAWVVVAGGVGAGVAAWELGSAFDLLDLAAIVVAFAAIMTMWWRATYEVMKLREDVDRLHKKVEELTRRLEDAQFEKLLLMRANAGLPKSDH